jgi:hypothetical protein
MVSPRSIGEKPAGSLLNVTAATFVAALEGCGTWGVRGEQEQRPCTHANYCDIIVLRGTKSHGEDPMSNRAFDQGPSHDATMRRWCFLLGWRRGRLVQDILHVHVPHNPPTTFEDLGLKSGSHVGMRAAWSRTTNCAVLPNSEGRLQVVFWSRYVMASGPVCHCQRISRFGLYT